MNRRAVVYHRPRERRRTPVVVVGLLGLVGLVVAQLAVSGALPDIARDRSTGVAVGPTAPVTADAGIDPAPGAVDPSLGPVPDRSPGPSPAPSPVPSRAPDLDAAAAEDLTPVPTTTVVFEVGAVLDAEGLADLDPVLAVLTEPGAAPALLTGSAEPGPDEASALRLAQQRADAVAAALVEAGSPASLLRTTAVVDPVAGRSVVVASEVP